MIEPGTTLEDAKDTIVGWSGDLLWPAGLSDEEERAAWMLIEIDDGTWAADLTPEAKQVLQESSGDKSDGNNIANASMIVAGINVYNALNPNEVLPDNTMLAEVK